MAKHFERAIREPRHLFREKRNALVLDVADEVAEDVFRYVEAYGACGVVREEELFLHGVDAADASEVHDVLPPEAPERGSLEVALGQCLFDF